MILRTIEDMSRAVTQLINLKFDDGQAWEFELAEYKRDRSAEQNRLAFKWYGEIFKQRGDKSIQGYRAYCKAHFGIPILVRDDAGFAEVYNRCIRPLSYEDKLEIIERMEIPITRVMNVKQMTEYLDAMSMYWAEHGVILSHPEDMHAEAR